MTPGRLSEGLLRRSDRGSAQSNGGGGGEARPTGAALRGVLEMPRRGTRPCNHPPHTAGVTNRTQATASSLRACHPTQSEQVGGTGTVGGTGRRTKRVHERTDGRMACMATRVLLGGS